MVGRAILKAHTDAGLSVVIADQDPDSLSAAVSSLILDSSEWTIGEVSSLRCGLPSISLIQQHHQPTPDCIPLLIESIPERLDLKRSFFSQVQQTVDPRTVLCSNTSTLRIRDLAEGLDRSSQFCGMHFFMPVSDRRAVELIQGDSTDTKTLSRAISHIEALGKTPLVVRDSPGFIVNRLLSPYLNEALMLLCQGVPAKDLEAAAIEYGMPISPLELIDTIGARTMFDAGRVYWQAFPKRIDPSPLLAGLVKSKRMGRYGGAGLFTYDQNDNRSDGLAEQAIELVDRYRRDDNVKLSQADLIDRLSIPMWIEAANAIADGTVTETTQFELAMQGGLGYRRDRSWLEFFDQLGSDRILAASDRWLDQTKAIVISDTLRLALDCESPSQAMLVLRHS